MYAIRLYVDWGVKRDPKLRVRIANLSRLCTSYYYYYYYYYYFCYYYCYYYYSLVFTTTGGMAGECMRYHSILAELFSTKKGENYGITMS